MYTLHIAEDSFAFVRTSRIGLDSQGKYVWDGSVCVGGCNVRWTGRGCVGICSQGPCSRRPPRMDRGSCSGRPANWKLEGY